MKTTVRPNDGYDYYIYVLIYVDDVMVINNDAESVLRRIDNYLNLNPSFIGNPNIYLGAKLKKMRLDNRVWAWEIAQKEISTNWWQTLIIIWLSWLMRVVSCQRRKMRTLL